MKEVITHRIKLGKSVQSSVWSSVRGSVYRLVDTSLWRPISDLIRWRIRL